MSKECTTHHHACDCREEKFRQLEQENAKLRENFMAAESEIILLREEREELRADKERLDWLARNRSVSSSERPIGVTPESLRASIDAARKETQP